MKQYIFYCFVVFGSIFSLVKTTKYPVIESAYDIEWYISFIPLFVHILMFYTLYRIVKKSDIRNFAFSIIPIFAVLTIRYWIFLVIPLILLNIIVLRIIKVDFHYWNVVNSSIIACIYSIVFAITFLRNMKYINPRINKLV